MHKHMVAHTQPHTGWRGVRRGRGRARGRGRGRGRGGPPFRAPANVRLASPADCTSQPTRTSRARVRLSERGCWVCTRAYVAPCLAAQPLRVSACPVAVCLSALSCLVLSGSLPRLLSCVRTQKHRCVAWVLGLYTYIYVCMRINTRHAHSHTRAHIRLKLPAGASACACTCFDSYVSPAVGHPLQMGVGPEGYGHLLGRRAARICQVHRIKLPQGAHRDGNSQSALR